MNALWDEGHPLTPAEVNARLDSGRELAYTTVMTILTRLFEKGVVTRERRGRAWAYQPVLDREEQVAQRMRAVLRDSGDESVSLARFVDNMNAKERAQLRKLLEARGRKQ